MAETRYLDRGSRLAAAALLLGALQLFAPAKSKAASISDIYLFQGANGATPMAGLTEDPQGRLYSTTYLGGAFGVGTVFRLTPPASGQSAWTEEILHSFDGNDGSEPNSPVTIGSDGTVYGVCDQLGAYDRGTVFSIGPGSGFPFTLLHTFNHQGGIYPNSGLLFSSAGLLYGTTPAADNNSYAHLGTIYSISPLGDQVEYEVAHAFGKPGDGYGPVGLSPAPTAYLNGFVGATTASAAGAETGNVYSFSTTPKGLGTETILYTFGAYPDFDFPVDAPIVGQFALAKSLIGCAKAGGPHDLGGIYQLTPGSGGGFTESILYNFGDQPSDPQAGVYNQCNLVQATPQGKIYGITDGGGAYMAGTFFEVDPPSAPGGQWTEKVDVSFNPSSSIGSIPMGIPLRVGNSYYGALMKTPTGNGAIYQLTP